jgi:hypothetical protein
MSQLVFVTSMRRGTHNIPCIGLKVMQMPPGYSMVCQQLCGRLVTEATKEQLCNVDLIFQCKMCHVYLPVYFFNIKTET